MPTTKPIRSRSTEFNDSVILYPRENSRHQNDSRRYTVYSNIDNNGTTVGNLIALTGLEVATVRECAKRLCADMKATRKADLSRDEISYKYYDNAGPRLDTKAAYSCNIEIEVRINEDLAALELENEHFEGQKKSRHSSFFERNPKLRLAAIKIHKLSCKVCGFNFNDFYGDHGLGFIEVHHLKPVSTLKASTKLSPENDMTVVCSNCHRMLHRNKDKVLTPAQLKELLRIP